MKKKDFLKKATAVALTATMGVGLLVGCGKNTDGTEAGKSAISTTDDGKTVIHIVRATNNLSSADDAEVAKVQDEINEYIADKIDVQVKLKEIPAGEYSDKCNLALANNEIDLLWTASWMGAVSCDNLYKGNGAYDLTDILEGTTLQAAMPQSVWESSSYDGKNYFVPIYKEVAEGYNLMFRKDLVDQFNWDFSSVHELKDIEPMLQDCLDAGVEAPLLTQATPFAYKFMLDEYAWILGGYLGIDREANEVVSVFETDEYRDYVKMMCEWAEKGYIKEGDATNSNPSNCLKTQYWGISWWTDVPNNATANARYDQEVEMVHMTGNWIDSNTTLGSCYAISSTCSEEIAKACVEFLGLLYTDKTLADLYTFGIEGTDYDRDADGKIVKKGELYNHSAWESTSFKNLSLESGEPDNKIEMYEAFNDAAKPSISSGFRFDSSSVEAQISAVGNVVSQYGFVLENGGFASDEVDSVLEKYKAAMDEAGYQDVYAAAVEQYNDWKASNK